MDEQPQKYYYKYNGLTYSNTGDVTNMYLIPQIADPNDPSGQTLVGLFAADSLKMRTDIIETALKDYSIDFIEYGEYKGTFSFTDSIKSANDLKTPNATVLTIKPVSSIGSAVLVIEANLDKDGTIYCIADRKKLIKMNQKQFQAINITISDIDTPQVEQILNCKNNNNYTAEYCFRVHVIQKNPV